MSDVSREIVRFLNSAPSCRVKYKVLNIKEGRDLITSGKIYALVVIPRKFKEDINSNRQPKLVYYFNNQMILVGGIISKDIQSALSGLKKSVLPIILDEHIKSNPYLNYSYFLSYASIAHIFQVFAALFAIWAVGVEFKEGTTIEWLYFAGNSILIAISAKLTPYFVILLFLMILSYLINAVFCSAPFCGNVLFSIAGACVFIFAYQFMGVLFVPMLSNLRFAMNCGAFYTSLGFTFAGMTYPFF